MINSYEDLRVYENAMDGALEIFQITKDFPKEERFSMTSQIRRSSRSVCANLAEAWRKRRYKAAFIAKLSDMESEACETQIWLEMAMRCGYLAPNVAVGLKEKYGHILGQTVKMIESADNWLIRNSD